MIVIVIHATCGTVVKLARDWDDDMLWKHLDSWMMYPWHITYAHYVYGSER